MVNELIGKRRRPLRASRAVRFRRAQCICEAVEQRLLLVSPLSAVPQLHSLPTANAKLFLDFNGDPGIQNWFGINVPATPAYDRDGDPKTFSDSELEDIEEVWARVAEKYSPFNLDVTTVDPGNRADRRTACILIGGSYEDWFGPPVGGVAPLGGFFNGSPNTGFVFSEDGVNSVKSVAEATAHEAGHLFGLEHHSVFDQMTGEKLAEYDPGDANTAPNMGVSYNSIRGLWARGPSSLGLFAIQDDLSSLGGSANGFGFRPDDHGETPFSATRVFGSGTQKGIISLSTDVDAFTFVSASGTLNVTATPFSPGGMLDARLLIVDPFGVVIGEADTASLSESLSVNVSAGTYTVFVMSAGGYGDIGQYTLSLQIPGGGAGAVFDKQLITGTDGDDVITISLTEAGYEMDMNGEITVFDPETVKQFDILAGGGHDVVTINTGVPKVYVLGGDGNDTITGGDFADTLTGAAGNDLIFGGGADDRIAGGAGKDYLIGGGGRDRLYGDSGNDVLKGGSSVDRLWGGDDNDVLVGDGSADKLYGELGNDTLYGMEGSDLLNGGEGLDQMYGGDGDDYFYSIDFTVDLLNGGADRDRAEREVDDILQSIEEVVV